MAEQAPESGRRRDERRGRLLVLGFCAVMALPLLSYDPTITIVHNRVVATMPAFTAGSFFDQKTYRQVDDSFRDHLQLRTQTVAAVAELGLDVADVSLNRQVMVGGDDRLYFTEDFTNPCRAPLDPTRLKTDLQTLAQAGAATAAPVTMLIVPNKTTIEKPDLGPRGARMTQCSRRDAARLHRLTEAEPDLFVNGLDILGGVTGGTPNRSLYPASDTHWLPSTASLVIRPLIENVARRSGATDVTWAPTEDDPTLMWAHNDLRLILGLDEPLEKLPTKRPQRPGAQTAYTQMLLPRGNKVRHYTTTGVPVIPGRTLMIFDSFVAARAFGNDPSLGQIAPYFADVTFVHWQALSAYLSTQPARFDRIVIEVVERNLGGTAKSLHMGQTLPDLLRVLTR